MKSQQRGPQTMTPAVSSLASLDGKSHKALPRLRATVINGSREWENQSPLEKRPLEGYPAPSSHF